MSASVGRLGGEALQPCRGLGPEAEASGRALTEFLGKARVLYVGPLNRGATCLDRLLAMRALGLAVEPFDTSGYFQFSNRLAGSLACRFHLGPVIDRFNRELREAASTLSAVTHVWIDKGVWVKPETLHWLRRRLGARLIHFTPDPQLVYHRSRFFLRSLSSYDLLFTTKPFELERYRRAGAQRVVLTDQAFDESRFQPRPLDARTACDVAFVGHFESHYRGRLRAAVRAGAQVKIWGPGWTRPWRAGASLRACVQGDGVWGDDYPAVLSSARIGLGLLSKLIPEETTTRSFEIPACGTMLLAERTAGHQRLFVEGKEAEFFGSDQELMEKIRHYLACPEARLQVAAAGRERCLRSGYGNGARLRGMLQVVAQLP